jgi:tetratricopeptide (TPR) repeat protein
MLSFVFFVLSNIMEAQMVMKIKGWKSEAIIFALSYITCGLVLLGTICFSGCAPRTAGDTPGKAVSSSADRKAELTKSLDRKFDDPKAQYELGRIYQNEGEWSQAEWRYNQALTFDPVFRQAQAAMVKVFVDSKQSAKEKQYADIYMQQVSASATQSLDLAMAFQEMSLDKYALACYQKALDLAPNSPNVHRQVGFYYLSKNDKEKAKEHLTLSYRLYPNQPDVALELGKLGVEVKRSQETPKPTPGK